MKINKKTLIVIAIVAVVGYLCWKKRKEAQTKEANTLSTAALPGTLGYILANVSFTPTEINKIKAVKASVDASTTRKEAMQAKADQKGHTFDEQVVLDAIWLLYHPKDAWIAGPDGSDTYGWRLQQKVINLN